MAFAVAIKGVRISMSLCRAIGGAPALVVHQAAERGGVKVRNSGNIKMSTKSVSGYELQAMLAHHRKAVFRAEIVRSNPKRRRRPKEDFKRPFHLRSRHDGGT